MDNNQKISKVEHIQISGMGHAIYSREEIAEFVEAPLIPACLNFYDKNIQTWSNNTGGDGVPSTIEIVYDKLDEENKKMADELVAMEIACFNDCYKNGNPSAPMVLAINVPTEADDKVELVADKFLTIANMFHFQDILFGFKNKQEVADAIGRDWNVYGDEIMAEYFPNENLMVKEIINYRQKIYQDYNFIYDQKEELFWEHPGYLERHEQYLATKSQEKSL